MYRAVSLDERDRDYHRFLWRDNPSEPVEEYRMRRVTVGIASAPFLATNSVLQLAEENRLKLQRNHSTLVMDFPLLKRRKKLLFSTSNYKSSSVKELSSCINGTQILQKSATSYLKKSTKY